MADFGKLWQKAHKFEATHIAWPCLKQPINPPQFKSQYFKNQNRIYKVKMLK